MAGIGKALGLFALGSLGSLAVRYVASDLLHLVLTKEGAFSRARELSNGKGIINLGAGPHRTFGAQVIAESPEVRANIDIVPDGMPRFLRLDIEQETLPFTDKQFGCVFASHVLEHLDNWQFALAEASRVADYVVVVLPHPAYFSGWLAPEHKQHFSRNDIQQLVELYPNVEIYF